MVPQYPVKPRNMHEWRQMNYPDYQGPIDPDYLISLVRHDSRLFPEEREAIIKEYKNTPEMLRYRARRLVSNIVDITIVAAVILAFFLWVLPKFGW